MTSTQGELRAVFFEALDRPAAEERAAYLDAACAGRPELRARVEALLEAHRSTDGFLGEPGRAVGADERPGAVIDSYKLLEEIGEGGFGVVFMAEQTKPVRRKVALKVLKPGMDSRQVIARFEAERQALALMDHPNIAHVFDGGETASGRPYFVMELVRGVPITDYCDQNGLAPRERLELFAAVCHAVQHAHQKGVIHRDLKPSNILVTLHDGVPVVKVIDFGIAKATGERLTDRTLFTNFSQMVGTPLYMSPEQAEMSGLDIDTRSDIYSLGVLLYELLTGTTPFDRERLRAVAYEEIRRIIREEEPPRPSKRISTLGATLTAVSAQRSMELRCLRQLLRGELDWIVMKALEKDRRRRYQTASSFAADVQHYLKDEPVQACPPSATYRFGKFARRHKVALTTITLVALALLFGLGMSLREASRAGRAEAQEREARRLAQTRLYAARLAEARALRRGGQVGQRLDSLRALEEAIRLARDLDLGPAAVNGLRNEAIACLGRLDLLRLHEWPTELPAMEDKVIFDAALEHYAVTDDRGLVIVRRTDTNQEVARLICSPQAIHGFRFSPDGKWLATFTTGQEARLVTVWDWRRGSSVFQTQHDLAKFPAVVAFTADSRRLVVSKGKSISVLEVPSGREVQNLARELPAHSLAASPDGARLAAAGQASRQIEVYDLLTGELVCQLPHDTAISGLAWDPSGRLLAAGGADDFSIHVWDVPSAREQAVLRGHQEAPWNLSFAPGGLLASTSWDGTVRLWNLAGGQEVLRLAGTHCQWSRDGRALACRVGQKVEVWQVVGGEEYHALAWQRTAGRSTNFAAGLSPDGRWLALGQLDGLRLFDLALERQTAFLPIGTTRGSLFLPSGKDLLTSGPQGLHRWPLDQQQGVLRLGPPAKLAEVSAALATDRKGKHLAIVDPTADAAAILDVADSAARARPLRHPRAESVAVSPNGRWLVTGTRSGYGVCVWDTATDRLLRDLQPASRSAAVAFRPDGARLVTSTVGGTADARTSWWEVAADVDAWRELRRLPEHGPFAWAPDGRLFAQALDRYRVRLTDGDGGQELAILEAPDDVQVHHLLFTPDGSRLIVLANEPAHVRVWDLRLVRRRLTEMDLDWDAPPYAAPQPGPAAPIRVETDLGRRFPSADSPKGPGP